ncbi:hypothetical protein QE152_g21955 [Popillia japonica]|uniref:Uncharacterized protein n=1 Tax=Popillia japonica TaxID=7064 RepID=A0AAW1KLR0_POPJA
MNKQTCDDIDENTTSEDEVTFLLRLRPSPPPRQRRHSLDYKSRTAGKRLCVSPTGWDISLEHKEQDPGRNKGRPPQSPTQCRRLSLTEGKDNAQ